MEEFNLKFYGSTLLFLLFIFCLLGFSIYVYRQTNPPVPRWLKNVLTFLRVTALLLILFILFEPILKLSWERIEKPTIAVMLDNSASMTLEDDGKSRSENAKAVLNSVLFQNGSGDFNFSYYQFSNRLEPFVFNQLDSVNFQSDGTDLATALKLLQEQNINQYLTGIILLSDGINNLGENPLRYAEELNIPIYPVSVGKVVEQNDVVISKLMTNQITYANNEVPVDVTIKASGYPDKKIKVDLLKNSQIIDSKYVEVSDELEAQIRLKFTPTEPGFQKYRVQTPVLENELTVKNNQKSFYVKVLKSRMKILYLTGAPGADFYFIKRILKAEKNFETDSWVAKKNQGFYQGNFPTDLNKLKDYDCIILQNFPPKKYSTRVISTLKNFLKSEQIPILFIAGNNINYQALSQLADYLPIIFPVHDFNEFMVEPVLTVKGRIHPVTRIEDDEFENQALWQDIPPIFYSTQNIRIYPGAEILLAAEPIQKNFRLTNKTLPLVVSKKFGNHKSLMISGYEIWRWDLMLWGIGKSNQVFKQFLSNSIRWLINKEDSKTVRIYPDDEIYRNGQQVTFTGEVYNKNYSPIDGAEVKLKVSGKNQGYEISLSGIGDGKYEGTLHALEGGDYKYEGVAHYKNMEMGSDKGQFSVEDFNLEYLQTRINENFLSELALKTGGQFITDSSFTSLETLLKSPARNILESREWQLWNKLLLLIAVILFLSLEWFIRKRSGML